MNVPVDPPPQQSEAAPTPESGISHRQPDPPSSTVDRLTLDEVFGQVLPETTSDERAERDERVGQSSDDWYYENRPPHHDR